MLCHSVADEEWRVELERRRVRLKARAAEVDKLVAHEKAEYTRLKEEERRENMARVRQRSTSQEPPAKA